MINTLSVEKTVDCDCTDATDDEVYTYVAVDDEDGDEDDADDREDEARKKIGQLGTQKIAIRIETCVGA